MGDFEDIYSAPETATGGDVGDFLTAEEKPSTSSAAKEDDIFGAVAEEGGEDDDDDDDDDDGVDISFAEAPGGSSAPSQVPHPQPPRPAAFAAAPLDPTLWGRHTHPVLLCALLSSSQRRRTRASRAWPPPRRPLRPRSPRSRLARSASIWAAGRAEAGRCDRMAVRPALAVRKRRPARSAVCTILISRG